LKDRVVRTVVAIEQNNGIEILRQCGGLKERYDKLMEFAPETSFWSPMAARQLVFYLHHKYSIDFGVCPSYLIDDDRQYCYYDLPRRECLCVIPQPYCIFRDKNGKPQHPEFLPLQIQQLELQFQQALSIINQVQHGAAP